METKSTTKKVRIIVDHAAHARAKRIFENGGSREAYGIWLMRAYGIKNHGLSNTLAAIANSDYFTK